MNRSNIENFGPLGRGELSDLIGETAIYSSLSPEGHIPQSKSSPLLFGQSDMPAQYLDHPAINRKPLGMVSNWLALAAVCGPPAIWI